MAIDKDLTDKEKISMGICVSPQTVDRCPYCVDSCDAFHWRMRVDEIIKEQGVNPNPKS